jgi:hypothetical protein
MIRPNKPARDVATPKWSTRQYPREPETPLGRPFDERLQTDVDMASATPTKGTTKGDTRRDPGYTPGESVRLSQALAGPGGEPVELVHQGRRWSALGKSTIIDRAELVTVNGQVSRPLPGRTPWPLTSDQLDGCTSVEMSAQPIGDDCSVVMLAHAYTSS